MGTNDLDNETPQPPAEQPRDVDLTNDSLLNGENGDQQPLRAAGQNRNDGVGMHRQKRRVARRKIRVELIKEPMDRPEDRGDGMGDEVPAETRSVPGVPPAPVAMPVTGGAYAAASAPASAGPAGSAEAAAGAKPASQNDNRLHINDLSQMSMPDLRGLASSSRF